MHQKRPLPNPIEDPRHSSGYILGDNKSLTENTYPREHNYFRTWELQRHPARGVLPAELPVDNQDYSRHYVDHIYESPTFSRRDLGLHEDGTQYFELDPDAEPFYPGAPGAPMRNVANPAPGFLNSKQRCSFPESTVTDNKAPNAGSFTSWLPVIDGRVLLILYTWPCKGSPSIGLSIIWNSSIIATSITLSKIPIFHKECRFWRSLDTMTKSSSCKTPATLINGPIYNFLLPLWKS